LQPEGVSATELDARALRRFAAWCLRYGPRAVVEASPGEPAVCVQVTGCEQVHGGWPQLLARVRADLARLELRGSAAIAPTTAAALVAAAHTPWQAQLQDDALSWMADAPLSLLRLEPEVIDTLEAVGVRTIGQFARLPAGGLGDRFGEAPWKRLQLALGRVPERLPSTVHRGPVRAVIEFDGPTSQAEAVTLAARQCVERLARGLLRKRLGTLHVRVSLDRASAPATLIDLRLARATRRAEHLWRLLQPHLERVHLGHDPAQGVQGVRVASVRHATLGLGQWKLIQGAAALDDGADPCWGEWLDQMRRRLGPAAIRVPHAQADPGDERAWQAKVAEGAAIRAEAPSIPVESLRALRPTVRVAPCRSIEVECDARRRPVRLRAIDGWLAVDVHDGPERIAAAWWRGERGVCDRWRVLAGGTWWWLRRQGAAWWIEGAWS
jgi:protein ImuB